MTDRTFSRFEKLTSLGEKPRGRRVRRPIRPIPRTHKRPVTTKQLIVNKRKEEVIARDANRALAEQTLPEFEMVEVVFNLLTYKQLENLSVVNITASSNSSTNRYNTPESDALGTTEKNIMCGTCKGGYSSCPGHFGLIKFHPTKPVLHPFFVGELINILYCICHNCGDLLIDKKKMKREGILKLEGKARFQAMANLCKEFTCSKNRSQRKSDKIFSCCIQPDFDVAKSINQNKIFACFSDGKRNGCKNKASTAYETKDILDLLDSIKEEDAKLFGFESKDNLMALVMRGLPVIPKCNRSTIYSASTSENLKAHLTIMYNDIVSCNNDIGKYIADIENLTEKINNAKARNEIDDVSEKELGETSKLLDKKEANLIFKIKHLFDNSDGKYKQNQKGPIAFDSFIRSHKGKENLFHFLLGKRGDLSGRLVIIPDPHLKVDQIRIPQWLAEKMSTRVKVISENIKYLSELLKTGRIKVVISIKDKKQQIVNDLNMTTITLNIGDLIDRVVQNGDYSFINRQPTIHHYGMFAQEVIIGPNNNVLGLHMSVTAPMNADFDGDESNIHFPTIGIEELVGKMTFAANVVSSHDGRNLLKLLYNAPLPFYVMTKFNHKIEKSKFLDIISFFIEDIDINNFLDRLYLYGEGEDYNEKSGKYGLEKYSGYALISTVFPKDFNYDRRGVKIKNGIWVKGTAKKSHFGSAHGSVILALQYKYGGKVTIDVVSKLYFIANEFLRYFPVSTGIVDCMVTDEISDTIQMLTEEAKEAIKRLGPIPENVFEAEHREKKAKSILDDLLAKASNLTYKSLKTSNPYKLLAKSGAKGNALNILQLISGIGQMHINGQIPNMRTIYTPEGTLDIKYSGFVQNSYKTGMDPIELLFHSIASRIGLTNTSTITAVVGAFSKKVSRALNEVMIHHDGRAADGYDKIYESVYGGDGLDLTRTIQVQTSKGSFTSYFDHKQLELELDMMDEE